MTLYEAEDLDEAIFNSASKGPCRSFKDKKLPGATCPNACLRRFLCPGEQRGSQTGNTHRYKID